MLKVSQATDIGLTRKLNEDSILCMPQNIFVVADGMGGHVAGEIASHIFTDTVKKGLSSGDLSPDENSLRELVKGGNRAILESVKEFPERDGMGTTATILYVHKKMAFWAHVGDSRLYHLRRGKLSQITSDHTYVAGLLASGSISNTEAANHPKRNMLLRAVGVDEDVKVDTGHFEIEQGDIFLLCSDGLTNMVSLTKIQSIMENQNIEDKSKSLVAAAKDGGGLDNISAIVVEYEYDDE